MSYVRLNIEDLEDAQKNIREVFLQQKRTIAGVREKINVHHGKARKTRRVFAVDSGFNRAYETPFILLKAAVVDEELEVFTADRIFLFHVDNYQTDRLRRLLMQQILYETLIEVVEAGRIRDSLMLVDGTITLTILYPTSKDP